MIHVVIVRESAFRGNGGNNIPDVIYDYYITLDNLSLSRPGTYIEMPRIYEIMATTTDVYITLDERNRMLLSTMCNGLALVSVLVLFGTRYKKVIKWGDPE